MTGVVINLFDNFTNKLITTPVNGNNDIIEMDIDMEMGIGIKTNNIPIEPKRTNEIDEIHELLMRTYIKSYENSVSHQWIILTQKLNGKWKEFEIFGFEINNTKPIQKISGLLLITGMSFIGINYD